MSIKQTINKRFLSKAGNYLFLGLLFAVAFQSISKGLAVTAVHGSRIL